MCVSVAIEHYYQSICIVSVRNSRVSNRVRIRSFIMIEFQYQFEVRSPNFNCNTNMCVCMCVCTCMRMCICERGRSLYCLLYNPYIIIEVYVCSFYYFILFSYN